MFTATSMGKHGVPVRCDTASWLERQHRNYVIIYILLAPSNNKRFVRIASMAYNKKRIY